MIVEKMEIYQASLRFKQGFEISRGRIGGVGKLAPHVLVRLDEEKGGRGWGESRSSHLWSYETNETVVSTLDQYLKPCIIGHDPEDLDGLHGRMDSVIAPGVTRGQPIAKSSIDIACHDLFCRERGISLSSHMGGGNGAELDISYLVSAGGGEEALAMTQAAKRDGYRGFKIKIGRGLERDVEVIAACREAAGNSFLWADANQAYSYEESLQLAREASKFDLQVLEQPMISTARRNLVRLSGESPVTIAIDESVFAPSDLDDFISWGFRGSVVVKVAKSGGLLPARRMIELARESELDLLGSGLTESMVGFSASLQLFNAMGIDHPVDLNGPQFIEDHISVGPVVERGRARIEGPGLGVRVDVDEEGKDGGKTPIDRST
jgi:muconate cycloisomerase